jgi:hypothetical protein
MAPRARSLRDGLVGVAMVAIGYHSLAVKRGRQIEPVDVSGIPADTVDAGSLGLVEANGLFFLNAQPFSGFIRESHDSGTLRRITSVYSGAQHGVTRTYYPDGQLRDARSYRANRAYGRHHGYWANQALKFDFQYVDDRREGIQKQWYQSGRPYTLLTYENDREVGLQQAWRESGRPFMNYEVRDGIRYGLQKSVLCNETEDGETGA